MPFCNINDHQYFDSKGQPTMRLLNECFEYFPEERLLRWKKRPIEHFANASVQARVNAKHAGRPTGTYMGKGISKEPHKLMVMGEWLPVNRIIWALEHSKYPDDHVNNLPLKEEA